MLEGRVDDPQAAVNVGREMAKAEVSAEHRARAHGAGCARLRWSEPRGIIGSLRFSLSILASQLDTFACTKFDPRRAYQASADDPADIVV